MGTHESDSADKLTQVAADPRSPAGKALRQKTEELERFVSLSLDMVCIAGMDGRLLRVNPARQRTLGRRPHCDRRRTGPFTE